MKRQVPVVLRSSERRLAVAEARLAGRAVEPCREGATRGTSVRRRTKLSVGLMAALTTVGTVVLAVGVALPAQADYAPGPNDIVGVGSESLQYLMDFVADGDPEGDAGFNSAGGSYKVTSKDATADSNARAAYLNKSTNSNLLPLDPTDVLRAGTYPIQRING